MAQAAFDELNYNPYEGQPKTAAPYFAPLSAGWNAQSTSNADAAKAAGAPVNLPSFNNAVVPTRTNSGDPGKDFLSLASGYAPSAKNLERFFPQFQQMYPGFQMKRNASGYVDALIAPNGQIWDTQQNAGPDHSDAWQWNLAGGPGYSDPSTNGVAGQMFDDPATKLFTSQVLNRIDDLMKSIHRPEDDAYRAAALKRVDELTKTAPYSASDEAALITQMRDPLTQARDARIRENKDRLGARNIGPSSGLYEDQVYNTPQRDYERALAGGTNDLAVRAIDEKSKRNNQALDILSNLVGLGQTNRNENNTQAREAITTGALLPDMSERRLQLLMQSLGISDNQIPSLMSSLTSLTGLNQQNSQFQAGQRQDSADAYGRLFGYLINSPLMNASAWR